MDDRNHSPGVAVLYGTQTGRAREVADRIWRSIRRHSLSCRVLSLDSYPIASLPEEKLVVFVCSTTGQGDVPDSMKKFWRFLLRRDLPPSALSAVSYAVCGLGDSAYLKFNAVGKRLDRRLAQLGANSVCVRAECDDQHPLGIDGALLTWIPALLEQIRKMFSVPQVIPDDELLPWSYELEWLEKDEDIGIESANGSLSMDFSSSSSTIRGGIFPDLLPAHMISSTRMTPERHWQDVRHVVFDVSECDDTIRNYSPGDVLDILPENHDAIVDRLLARLGLSGDQRIRCMRSADLSEDHALPLSGIACSLRELFTCILDIASSPRRFFFEVCSHFAQNDRERERLAYFASPDGSEDLHRYNDKEFRNFADILEDFPSVSLPLPALLECVPILCPRSFSIASSSLATPNEIHLCVAIVDFDTPFHRHIRGCCSSFLCDNRRIGGTVFVRARSGTFTFPSVPTPVILIGPGTGCAPFRSLVHELSSLIESGDHVDWKKKVHFYFGCRNRDMDYHFAREWESFFESGVLATPVHVAFSRDNPDRKVYVQDLLLEDAEKIWSLIEQDGASVYIAGSARRMPNDVLNAIQKIARLQGRMSVDAAAEYVSTLQRNGRLQMETWS